MESNQQNEFKFWKTEISKTFWNDLEISKSDFPEAELCIGDEEPHSVSWLDEILRGGIKIFNDKPITLLVKGPPGSGKTTFALELCYRLAINKTHPIKSLYISVDSDSEQIIRNAKNYR